MKIILSLIALNLISAAYANAEVLPPEVADSICRKKALNAAHFISESDKKFVVKYEAADVAEIGTAITYKFTYPGVSEALFRVNAYAYGDDGSCDIEQITSLISGND